MSKILALLLAVVMVVGVFAGCSNNETKDPVDNPEITEPAVEDENVVDPDGTEDEGNGELDEEMPEVSEICQTLVAITNVKPMQFPTMAMDIDLTDEFAVKSYTGLDTAEGVLEAAVSEAMMGSQAYSVVLVKVADEATAAATAENMFNGINPRKWICVEADDLKVAVSGDMIILAMLDDEYAADCTAADLLNAFATNVGEISAQFGE